MNRWRHTLWMVAILALGVARDAGAVVYPTLSLPTSYTDLRMLKDATGTPGSSKIIISKPKSNIAGDYLLTSPTINIDPSSGAVARGRLSPIPFSLGWKGTSSLGPQQDIVTLTGNNVNLLNDEMTVTGAVVANRHLTIDRLGEDDVPLRVMFRQPYTTTMRTGSVSSVDGDDYATRVNTKLRSRASATDGNDMLAKYKGTPLAQFNDVNQSAEVDVIFYRTGNIISYYDLAPDLLKDGEAASVGAALQPLILDYNVDVLKQRLLRPSSSLINFGNVLKGSTMAQQVTMYTRNENPDVHHCTRVTVTSGDGNPVVTSVGELNVTPTPVEADGVPVTVTGTFNTYGTLRSLRGLLGVTTAEDPTVDTKPYRNVSVSYAVNVGLATIGRTRGSFDGAMVLSAFVQSGGVLDGLASKVKPRRTLAEDMTLPEDVAEITYNQYGRASQPNMRALYQVVGSEAEIVASTNTLAPMTVKMQWRRRSLEEAHAPRAPGDFPIAAGESAKWLTSDVVKIEDVTSDIVYALQMTFDNRINLALDGQMDGQLNQQWEDMWIAQWDDGDAVWERAAFGAAYGHYQSLSDFLAANLSPGTPLEYWEGHWGVDPAAASDPQQRGHSWAIVRGGGSGIFAVVPEPATLVLLISALAGLFAYTIRRHRDFFRLHPVAMEAGIDLAGG